LRERLMEGVVVRKLGEAFGLSAAAARMLMMLAPPEGSPRLSLFVGNTSDFVDAIDFTTQAERLADPSFPQMLEEGTDFLEDGTDFPSLAKHFDAVRWLAKSAVLIGQMGLGDDDLRWLLERAVTHSLLSPADLSIEPETGPSDLLTPWLDLQRFVAFAREHADGLPALRAVFKAN